MSMSEAAPGLQWGHPDLDHIFAGIREFSTMLITADSAAVAEMLINLGRKNLCTNTGENGLICQIEALAEKGLEGIDQVASQKAIDLLIIDARGSSTETRNDLAKRMPFWPSAVIVICVGSAAPWKDPYDVCLNCFSDFIAVTTQAGTQKMPWSPRLMAKKGPDAGPAIESEIPPQLNIGFFQVPTGITEAFQKLLASEAVVVIEDVKAVNKGYAAFVCTALKEMELYEQIRKRLHPAALFLVIGTSMRRSDRLTAYQGGANFIFDELVAADEILACLSANRRGFSSSISKLEKLEAKFLHLLRQLRRNTHWKAAKPQEFIEQHLAVVSNLMERAALSGSRCGAIVLRIPDLSNKDLDKNLHGLLKNSAIHSLLSNLRQDDISLVLEGNIVVLSHQLSMFSAKKLLSRMNTMQDLLDHSQTKPKLLLANANANATANWTKSAELFLRTILKNCQTVD